MRRIAIVLISFGVPAYPQTPATRNIDIGVREAPLTEHQKAALGSAIEAHNYAAEKIVLDGALAEHPNSRELLIVAGRIAWLEKQPKDAAAAMERADRIKPLGDDDRMTLALAYQFTARPIPARAELVKLTEASPRNAQYFYLLGHTDALDRHMEQAISSLHQAVALDPNLMRAWEELGQAQEDLGLTDDAGKTYAAAAERNRLQNLHFERAPLNYGIFLLKAGDTDRAEKLFLESLQSNPRFAWAHYYLGQLDRQRNRNSEAMAEYRAAVVNDPSLRQAWLALGREYHRLGQTAESEKCLAIFKQLEKRETAPRETH